MLKKIFCALALLIACVGMAAAQTHRPSDANIQGHVVDTETGEHLAYYTIRVLGTGMGAITDNTGHYTLLNLTPGTYTLEASCPGYATQTRKVEVKADNTLEVNFDVAPDTFMLDQVVVTASKSELRRRNSPALIQVVNDKLLNIVGACSLADGLSFQPGVRVENDCQNCGFTQVRINGLDGHYSQILMNSRPVFSALTGVYGLEQIPANMIERIEVMRGGGSALFGSSAIGGTVNIITKDPMTNYAEAAHGITSMGISGKFDNNTTVNASVVSENGKIGMFVYGQNRLRDGYDHNDDGFTEIAQLKSQTLGVRSVFRPTADTRLSAEWHGTHEARRGGDQLDVPSHQALISEEVDHNINAGEASFDLWSPDRNNYLSVFAAVQNTQRTSYYGSNMDPNAYGRTHDIVVTSGAQYTRQFSRLWFMPAEFIGGLEYDYNRLHDVTIGYDHNIIQKVNIYSAYVQNEWRDDRWGFLVGVRADKHSMIRNPIFSPRVNVRFNPSEHFNFRASYSTGFRSPQAYDEDFHVAIVGGERVVTILAPNLKQESSNSFSVSADIYERIGNVQTNFTLEGFYTNLRDAFAIRVLDEPDALGNTVQERYNGSGATVLGMNLEAKAALTSRLQCQLGFTWQQSRYKQPEYWSENPGVAPVRRMFRAPDTYGYITVDYNITRRLHAMISGTYTGSMLVEHLAGSGTPVDIAVDTPRYFDANIKLEYEFRLFDHVDLDLGLGVLNIFNSYQRDFDKGVNRDSGYIYGPTLPRSLAASVKLHL